MVTKAGAMRQLGIAFNQWTRLFNPRRHYFGVVMVMMSHDGVDLQYLGEEPMTDGQALVIMQMVAEKMAAGEYSIDHAAAVPFQSLS